MCNCRNLSYTSFHSTSSILTCFSSRSSLSVVSSGSERCFFPLNIHCNIDGLPLSEWRGIIILSFPLCPAPPTPQGYASHASKCKILLLLRWKCGNFVVRVSLFLLEG